VVSGLAEVSCSEQLSRYAGTLVIFVTGLILMAVVGIGGPVARYSPATDRAA